MSLATHLNPSKIPQTEPIPGRDMVANSAGGHAFALDKWGQLDRFLILGSEGGTYYATEREVTVANAAVVTACAKEDAKETVRRIVEISDGGRAPKNDYAVLALAVVAAHADDAGKQHAYAVVSQVCRIGTHLFQFVEACKQLRGFGRGLRRAIARWYEERSAVNIAYQAVKYQQRHGYSHRDLLRLSHPRLHADADKSLVADWILKGWPSAGPDVHPNLALRPIWAFERCKAVGGTPQETAKLVRDHQLDREFVKTEHLESPEVWEALLPHMKATALIRNLAHMTRVGLLKPLSDSLRIVENRLSDADWLRKGRIHPLAVLVAQRTYAGGKSIRGSATWVPEQRVVDALDGAFYTAFGAIEPTGKKWLLALDVSGSMSQHDIAGMPGITPRVASAAMALVTAATEPQHHVIGFTGQGFTLGSRPTDGPWHLRKETAGVEPIPISAGMRLGQAVDAVSGLPMGPTDCALPMIYAAEKKIEVDAFVVYCVDTETEILTAGGWKKYDQLLAGEEVYTLNHETGEGEWQANTAVNIFPEADRELLRMEGRTHSSLTTMNHRWPVRNRSNSGFGRRWRESKDLNQVDYIQCAARDSGLPKEPVYKDSFVELMAWGWTEGSWNGSEALSICQSSTVNEELCQSIREALFDFIGPRHNGSMYDIRNQGTPAWVEDKPRENGVIHWRLNQEASKPFKEFMDEDKAVCRKWLRSLTLKQLDLFIETSMLADGSYDKRRLAQKVRSRSESFAFACILSGKAVSFVDIDNDHNNGVEVGILRRTEIAPLAHASNKDGRPFKFERVRHSGKVWCPTTPNGTWLARRNGSVYWTGNTDNETWFGGIHPVQALKQYRDAMGRAAKLIVVGMTANPFTIADPNDASSMDVVGFDTAAPAVMADFVRN